MTDSLRQRRSDDLSALPANFDAVSPGLVARVRHLRHR